MVGKRKNLNIMEEKKKHRFNSFLKALRRKYTRNRRERNEMTSRRRCFDYKSKNNFSGMVKNIK